MEDLSRMLTEVLEDPDKMQQVMEVAASLGLNPSGNREAEPLLSQETVQKMAQFLHQAEEKDKRQETLMRALLPYLTPRRQARLERAMQLSHLSRMAGVAMQSDSNALFRLREEQTHV